MWINNYNDPEEMDIATALNLLGLNGFKDVTNEANKQNGREVAYVFDDPSGVGVHYCHDDEEVIDLVITLELEEPEGVQ